MKARYVPPTTYPIIGDWNFISFRKVLNMSTLNPMMMPDNVQQTMDSHLDDRNSLCMTDMEVLSFRIGITAVGRQMLVTIFK
jgi:hypothetical protein